MRLRRLRPPLVAFAPLPAGVVVPINVPLLVYENVVGSELVIRRLLPHDRRQRLFLAGRRLGCFNAHVISPLINVSPVRIAAVLGPDARIVGSENGRIDSHAGMGH